MALLAPRARTGGAYEPCARAAIARCPYCDCGCFGPVQWFDLSRIRAKSADACCTTAAGAAGAGILGGYSLVNDYAELGQALLVCATETKTPADIDRYTDNMARIIGRRFQPAPCAIKPS